MFTAASKLDDTPGIYDAQRVLEAEGQALLELSRSLGDDFIHAIEILECIKGRVIVTGIGKSGHIAGKIAATLASTGTPSFFIHPSEASHGDLGMITENDALIMLSNSGETSELFDLISYAKRFSIPLISISSNADSFHGSCIRCSFGTPKCRRGLLHGTGSYNLNNSHDCTG